MVGVMVGGGVGGGAHQFGQLVQGLHLTHLEPNGAGLEAAESQQLKQLLTPQHHRNTLQNKIDRNTRVET